MNKLLVAVFLVVVAATTVTAAESDPAPGGGPTEMSVWVDFGANVLKSGEQQGIDTGVGITFYKYFGLRGFYSLSFGEVCDTKIGLDALGVLPLAKNVSVFAGPGFFWREQQNIIDYIVLNELSAHTHSAPVPLKSTQYTRMSLAVGVQLRPLNQLSYWGAFPHTKLTDRFMVTGGYHTERGLTFGAGFAF